MKKAALLAACAALYLICRDAYYVGFFNDDAFYIIGARSLLEGRYAELNAPGQPPLVNYLPGFSMLLAPVAALAGTQLWPYQLAALALMLAGLRWFAALAPSLAPQSPLSALALAALTPLTVSLSGAVLSDVPLFAAAMAALLWARKIWEQDCARRWLPLALLLGFCGLLRPTGAALAAAFALALSLEQRWKPALLCYLGACVFLLPFLIRNHALTGRGLMYVWEMTQPLTASSPWAALATNAWMNAAYYLKFSFVSMLYRWPVEHALLTAATVGVCGVATLYGMVDAGWKGWRKLPAIFLAVYVAIHLVWGKQAGRYLLPALPLIFAYFLRGAAVIAGRSRFAAGRAALGAACLALALFAAPDWRIARASLAKDSPVTRPAERTHAWIKANTVPRDILAAELDGRLHLLTGRQVVHLRRLFHPDEFARWLADSGARYVVLMPGDFIMTTASKRSFNDPMPVADLAGLLSDRQRYELVFSQEQEGAAIYRRR